MKRTVTTEKDPYNSYHFVTPDVQKSEEMSYITPSILLLASIFLQNTGFNLVLYSLPSLLSNIFNYSVVPSAIILGMYSISRYFFPNYVGANIVDSKFGAYTVLKYASLASSVNLLGLLIMTGFMEINPFITSFFYVLLLMMLLFSFGMTVPVFFTSLMRNNGGVLRFYAVYNLAQVFSYLVAYKFLSTNFGNMIFPVTIRQYAIIIGIGTVAIFMGLGCILVANYCDFENHSPEPDSINIFGNIIKCILVGFFRIFTRRSKYRAETEYESFGSYKHWIHNARGAVPEWLLENTWQILNILWLWISVCFYWAGSIDQKERWLEEAQFLNVTLPFGDELSVPGCYLSVVFPVFTILSLPILYFVKISPISKITIGLSLATVSMTVAAVVSHLVENTVAYHLPATDKQASFSIRNLASITKSGNLTFPFSESPTSLGFKSKYKLLPKEKSNTHHKIIPNQNFEITWTDDKNHKINLNKKASNELILTDDHSCIYEGFTEKPLPLTAGIKFVNLREPDTSITVLGNFLGDQKQEVQSCKTKKGVMKDGNLVYDIREGEVKYLPRGRHTLTFPGSGIQNVELSVESGENYVLFLMQNEVVVEKAVEGNKLTVLVLIPQFLIISAAEAFLGVGGLEMAIQRAPARLPTIM